MDLALATSQSAQHSPSQAGASPRASRSWWIAAVTTAAVAVRLIGVTQPLVGTFATKHCVYAMIARNWAEGRAEFWQPTLDCLAPASDERAWHLMEWPASAFVAACGYRWFGGDLDVWGRGVSIFCMAAATVLSYLLARRWFGEAAARATSLVIAFAPIGVIYGRGFMLEPSLVALSFATLYAFDRWCRGGSAWWLLPAGAAFALAMLTKFYMVLLCLGLFVSIWRHRPTSRIYQAAIPCLTVIALLPLTAWFYWLTTVSPVYGRASEYHPETRADVHGIPHSLLADPSYFVGVLGNLATVTLTPLGLLLAVVGLTDRRARWLLPWFGLSCGLLFLLPLKFHVANYYYLNLLAPAALLVGLGWQSAVERFAPSAKLTTALVACSLLIAARYAIGPTWRVHEEDRAVLAAAEELQALAAVEEPVATLHGSTLDLLYYCDRRGWALDAGDQHAELRLQLAVEHGAKRLVVVHPAHLAKNERLTRWLSLRPLERSGDDWQIYRLDGPPQQSVVAPTAAEFPPHPARRTVAR